MYVCIHTSLIVHFFGTATYVHVWPPPLSMQHAYLYVHTCNVPRERESTFHVCILQLLYTCVHTTLNNSPVLCTLTIFSI